MKKKINKIGYLLFIGLLIAGISSSIVLAQDGTQSVPKIFIPVVAQSGSITGRVLSQQNVPIQGVLISVNNGRSATTDQNGNYALEGLGEGTYNLVPSKENMAFSPASSSVVVPPNAKMLNFTAQVNCSEAIVNGGFESSSGWVFPITEYTASYDNSQAHSGARSARTGIVNPADNRYSYSSTRQPVTIPSGTTSAYLTFWIKPYTSQVSSLSLPTQPAIGSSADQGVLSTDVQYVLVLDSNFNIINTLVWQISNSQAWTQYSFNLAGYAGRTIWLHFGTYNDGLDGISSLFIDDVSIQLCPGGSPTPPPPTPGPCGNLILNPSFESTSNWEIPVTAYSAGYSTQYAHSGSHSMRTGIVNANDNRYSYSDFRQKVTIPSGATVAKASFWLYSLSGETSILAQPEMIEPTGRPFSETPLSGDVQYVLVLDAYQNWIDTLVWQRTNEGYWHYFEFDLLRYKGQTIYLQFGTYNDGAGGISSMFVDDVALSTCTVTPTPGPSPTPTPSPGPCQERIVNNNFEGSNGWEILNTAYPPAYSNAQYHSAFRSMRTGITDAAQNRLSYSDFRQWVSIPSSTHHVTLRMWLLPSSTSTNALEILPFPERTQHFGDQPATTDVQYLLILDQNLNWIDTLIWMRSSSTWTNMTFDLSRYAGWTIALQWGTANDGYDGITSMYVDDVSLQACP